MQALLPNRRLTKHFAPDPLYVPKGMCDNFWGGLIGGDSLCCRGRWGNVVSCWMLVSVLYRVKESLMLRPCPSVCLWIDLLSATTLLVGCNDMWYGSTVKTSSSWREFHENRLSDSHTLLKSVNILRPYFPCFLTDLSEIRYRRSAYNAVWLSWKSVQWEPHLVCWKAYMKFCLVF
jgi:hypothetical protein